MKPSLLPRRNPAIDNEKFQENPAVITGEVEARNRLKQIPTRTISLPARGPRLNPSFDPCVKSSKEDDVEMSPIDELRRERDAIMTVRRHTSVVPTSRSPPKADLNEDDDDPRQELRGQRKESIVPKAFGEASRISSIGPGRTQGSLGADQRVGSSLPGTAFCRRESKAPPNATDLQSTDAHVRERTGASLPVKPFGRRQSKVPPNTTPKDVQNSNMQLQERTGASLPVMTFGRHESKVPPNTTPKDVHTDAVASHTGTSLPVNTFARHTSKVPSSFVATSGEPKRMDRQSIVPPSTRKAEKVENYSVPQSHAVLDSSRPSFDASPGAFPTSGQTNKPPRTTFGNIARAFRKKQRNPSDSNDAPARRMLSLPASRLPSFRRKPTTSVAAS